MKQEYIILRQAATQSSYGNSNAEESLFADVEVEELTIKEAENVRQRRDVMAITPNMPVELISSSGVSEGRGSTGVWDQSWGIEAVGAGECPFDGSGMVTAVLDTGIDRHHPAFSGLQVVEHDFTGDGDGDANGHGTHSAGTIFGREVNDIQVGVAPGIDYALVAKVLDDEGVGESWNVVQALLWAADNSANVISLSMRLDFARYVYQLVELGYPQDIATPVALEAYHTTISFYEKLVAILRLKSEALVITAGAGDASRRFDNLAWDKSAEAPARVPGIFGVGALASTSSGLKLADFSNSGAQCVAPGVGIVSSRANSQEMISRDGTVMASNYAAGVSLLWAQFLKEHGDLNSFSLEAKITRSAEKSQLRAEEEQVGLGIVQAPNEKAIGECLATGSRASLSSQSYQVDSIDAQTIQELIWKSVRKRH